MKVFTLNLLKICSCLTQMTLLGLSQWQEKNIIKTVIDAINEIKKKSSTIFIYFDKQ